MKTSSKRPIIIGIFIFLGLVILFVTVFTLGGQKKAFGKSVTISAVFEDVEGLLPGGNVWFSGVKIGTIKKINFYSVGQVQVNMDIERDAQQYIRKDAMAKIGSDGLIGNKIVVIFGGTAAAPQVDKDDVLKVEKAVSMDNLMATFQSSNKNILDITTDFKRISKKIDSGNGTLASLINDPQIANKVGATLDNLQTVVANFKAVSVNSKAVLANLESFSGQLNKPNSSVNELLNDTVLYENMRGTMDRLQRAAKELSEFTANANNASKQLNNRNSPVGLLLNDSTSAAAMQATLKNLESSSHKLDEDLEAAQHNFLLKGFFKKREKEKQKQQAQ